MSAHRDSERVAAITSRTMAAVHNRDSTAELAIRRRLWANGLRFRLQSRLPGRPDIVFTRRRAVVFIDGDLWHGNSWRIRGLPNLESQFPNRTEWWVSKIRRNMQRDREVSDQLVAEGWTVLRHWESDVLRDPNGVAKAIAESVLGMEQMNFRLIDLTPVERRRQASVVPAAVRHQR